VPGLMHLLLELSMKVGRLPWLAMRIAINQVSVNSTPCLVVMVFFGTSICSSIRDETDFITLLDALSTVGQETATGSEFVVQAMACT